MAENGVQKLSEVFKPMMDNVVASLTQVIVANSSEIVASVKEVSARVEVLEKSHSEKKKVTKAPAKTADAAAGGADATAPKPADAKPAFIGNIMLNFKDRYKNDAAFREKYETSEMKLAMEADVAISAKKDDQKITAKSIFAWSYMKNYLPGKLAEFTEEFNAAKKAHAEATKPPQETVEKNTPPPVPQA